MKLSYRADIDGLRALAILLVVFYHLQINLNGATIFQFGYIGVDIFCNFRIFNRKNNIIFFVTK